MKKQILLLIVAVMAGITVGWGQPTNPLQPVAEDAMTTNNPTCIPAAIIDCEGDHLNPVPGTEYEYIVSLSTPFQGSAGTKYRWFITQDINIISTNAAGETSITENILSGTNAIFQSAVDNYNDIVNGTQNIKVVWKSFVHNPAQPVLLVVYVEGANGCITNNVEVYLIKPKHAFALEIANINPDGSNEVLPICVSPVRSATFDPTLNSERLTMNYGTNYVYFMVNASNFTDSWEPNFNLATVGGRTSTIEWQYPALANVATGWNSATTPVVASAGPGNSVGKDGECIIVRVTIDHGNIETIAPFNVDLGVDGRMKNPNGTDYPDTFGDVNATCDVTLSYEDRAVREISPRPDINSVNPVAPLDFVPKN